MNDTLDVSAELEHLDKVHRELRLICGKILTPSFCFVGFIANILNVVVLTRAWMSSSTNVYLTAVAVCDLFYLLFSFLFSLYVYDTMRQMAVYMYTVTFILGTANLFSNTTTWLTVCFTLERFVAISSPILGRRFCTQQRARYAVAIIFLLSLIITFPDYLKGCVKVKERNDNTTLPIVYMIVPSSLQDYLIIVGYDYWNQVLFVFLPMILLIVFNSLLVRSVMRADKGRDGLVRHGGMRSGFFRGGGGSGGAARPNFVKEALEASMKTTVNLASTISKSFGQGDKVTGNAFSNRRPILGEQQRITLMLISIVMAFVLLQLPSTVPTITENLWTVGILSRTDVRKKYLLLYSNVSNVLLIINAAMNFVFYSLFSAKFRQTCYMVFQQCECFGPQSRIKSMCTCLPSNRRASARKVCGGGRVVVVVDPTSIPLTEGVDEAQQACDRGEMQSTPKGQLSEGAVDS